MKKIHRLSFFILILWPVFALAQSKTDTPIFNLLNPPAVVQGTDISIGYLEDIFGIVDGVLHGSGSQIMGEMFAVFNAAALSLGVIIMLYTTILSISNTAGEGEFLGRKLSSIWIPFRTTLGVALLIPKATGYSTIQIFMMWAIVQGVAAADSVWNAGLNYLSRGGVLVQQSLAPQGNISNQAKEIFRAQVCMYGLEAALEQARIQGNRRGQNIPFIPSFGNTVNPLNSMVCPKTTNKKTCTIKFPGKFATRSDQKYDFNRLSGICGQVTFNYGTSPSNKLSQETQDSFIKAPAIAMQQLINDLGSSARIIVNTELRPKFRQINIERLFQPDTFAGVGNRIFLQSAEDYQGLILPASSIKRLAKVKGQEWIRRSKNEGWILAGAYYHKLINLNNDIKAVEIRNIPRTTSTAQLKKCLNDGDCASRKGQNVSQTLKNLLPGTNAPQFGTDVADFVTNVKGNKLSEEFNKFIVDAPTEDKNYGGRENPIPTPSNAALNQVGGLLESFVAPLITPLLAIARRFTLLRHAQQTGVNPEVILAGIGSSLINWVTSVYIEGTVIIATTTAGLAAVPFEALGTIPVAVVTFFGTFIWSVSTFLLVNGAVLAYYIPLIPFILFLFGAIGWIMQVIEAMVAAPIVALGVTHPEGQEILGKADPAVLLLVNVFLRPSMMIIGLIASIILSYVAIWLLNHGFFYAFFSAVKSNVSGFALALFIFPAMLAIYTLLVIGVLNQVFDLINQVPDKVMTWIGGREMSVGGEAKQAAGEVKQGFTQAAQTGAEGLKAGAEKAGSEAGSQLASSQQTDQGDMQLSQQPSAEELGPLLL